MKRPDSAWSTMFERPHPAQPRRLKRRTWLLGTAAAGLGMAALLRPPDRGAPHSPYFRQLGAALADAGIGRPTLVVDQPRFEANLRAIRERVPSALPLRVVVKSLPSLDLVDTASRLWNTDRAMLFNGPQVIDIARARPGTGILLGKPLNVREVQRVLEALPEGAPADCARRIEWLVDTPERLAQYRELARGRRQTMRINVEIDVGLHRGGVEDADTLASLFALLREEPLLSWSGFMGYDAHTAGIPDLPGLRAHAMSEVHARYDAMMAVAREHAGVAVDRRVLTFNSGGSHTLHLHDGRRSPNEISVGSASVLPTDFEVPEQAELQAASFIATPVLKTMGEFRLPVGVEWIGRAAAAWDPNQARAFAVHGGNWLATPVSPPGVQPSGLFGPSSNQQVMTAPASAQVEPDDWVFWRPRQSEAVFLQFGDIAVFDGRRIVARWPVFPASA
jgi:D-serine deaminase-like pyridoxal phosphate-dependent protein